MPHLILCADDFGLSPAISGTIAELGAEGRINAISCMASLPGWESDAQQLTHVADDVEIGIHLVLSEGRPLTAMPEFAPSGYLPGVDRLTARAWCGRLALDEIKVELTAQFDRFVEVMGRVPEFIDGHQHVHALPSIRRIVVDLTAQRAPHAWVRVASDQLRSMMSRPFAGKAIGSAFHSIGFARAARRRGLRCNDSFAGHYDYRGDYKRLFPTFLRRPGERHVIMCHPGAGATWGDGIAVARVREAAALRALPVRAMAAAAGLDWGTIPQKLN